MKRNRIIVVVLAFTLTIEGCSLIIDNSLKGDNIPMEVTKGTEVSKDNFIDTFFKLMDEDKVGDKKSVYWDGNAATMVDDEFDDPDIVDFPMLIKGSKNYRVDKLIECIYPETFELVDIDSDQLDKCHFIDEEHELEIFIQQIDYGHEVKSCDSNLDYKKTDKSILADYQTCYFKKYKLYIGIKEINEIKKAGYVLLFESDLADRSYMIEVYGLGDMEVIKENALFVMNGFHVLWH